MIDGYSSSYGAGNNDVYIIMLDSTGSLKWAKTVGGKMDDEATSIIQTNDGGYAITGFTNSFGAGSYDVYFIKLDSLGNSCNTLGGGGKIDSGGIAYNAL